MNYLPTLNDFPMLSDFKKNHAFYWDKKVNLSAPCQNVALTSSLMGLLLRQKMVEFQYEYMTSHPESRLAKPLTLDALKEYESQIKKIEHEITTKYIQDNKLFEEIQE